MSERHIQRATVAVAEQLAEVYQSAYQENRRLGLPNEAESASGRQVADWIQQKTVFVVKNDEDVIGGVCHEVTDSDCVKLSRLGVRETSKGKGVGTQLLDYAEEQVRHCGYSTIWLLTPAAHPYLPDMYRRRGYEHTGTVPQEGREFEFLVMEKDLR